jgi:hypothetical protein
MVMHSYRGVVQEDGHIVVKGDADLPVGAEVIITVIDEDDEEEEVQGVTGEELLNAPFIGVWADRDDMGDTAEFVENLRRKWENRND